VIGGRVRLALAILAMLSILSEAPSRPWLAEDIISDSAYFPISRIKLNILIQVGIESNCPKMQEHLEYMDINTIRFRDLGDI
jgi:hypothetical protein